MRQHVVGIAGVGLIGGSVALRARELGCETVGWDPSAAHLGVARERGALTGEAGSFPALAAACDTLVLAGPLAAVLAQLGELAARPGSAALILDTASVKAPVEAAGRGVAAFVASHPLAGSERSGPGAARADLFAGRTWTYDPAAAPAARAAARTFLAALGARPLAIAGAEHDALVALSSHLPQLLSTALGARLGTALGDDRVAALCGPGMGSMLRLARSPWQLWEPILAANAGPVAQEARALANVLLEVASALDAGRPGALEPLFADAALAAERLAAATPASDATLLPRTPPPTLPDSRFSP